MRWIFRHIYVRAFSRQTTSWMLLLTVVSALLPVPILLCAPGLAKDRSQAFPCQDRPCGCMSAEQCRKKCCCFNKEQKIAWAKRNGVDISTVLLPNQAEKQQDTKFASTKRSCCKDTASSKSAGNLLGAACQTRKARPDVKSRCNFVVGIVAQECQGVTMTLIGLPMFVLPASVSLEMHGEAPCQRFTLTGSRLVSRDTEPPVPPPRLDVS